MGKSGTALNICCITKDAGVILSKMVRECVCLCLSLCVCLFVCECVCVRAHALVCICVCVCVYTCVMSVCVSADDTYLGSSLNSCWALLLSSYTAVSS